MECKVRNIKLSFATVLYAKTPTRRNVSAYAETPTRRNISASHRCPRGSNADSEYTRRDTETSAQPEEEAAPDLRSPPRMT